MKMRARDNMLVFTSSLSAAGACLIALALFLILGPLVEGRYAPVTSDVKVLLLRTENHTMVFDAWGVKNRSCSLVDIKALVTTKGERIKGTIFPLEEGVGDRVRPLGTQFLGTWAIQPVGERIEIQTWYRCHPLWLVQQNLGEWPKAAIGVKK